VTGFTGFQNLGADLVREVTVDAKKDVRRTMLGVQDRFVRRAPHLTGQFIGSLDAYRGTPPENEGRPANQPSYPPPGHDQIDAVLHEWEVGIEVGLVDQVAYADFLARGGSKRTPTAQDGWLDVIAEEAVR
jgi:hypothetical protein